MKKLLKGQAGFSLLQVTVMSAGLAVTMLGIATMTNNLKKSSKSLEKKGDWTEFRDSIRATLLSETKCGELLGLTTKGIDVDESTTMGPFNPLPIILAGTPLNVGTQHKGLYITELRLDAIQTVGADRIAKLHLKTSVNPPGTPPEQTQILGAQDYYSSFDIKFYPSPAPSGSPDKLDKCVSAESDANNLFGKTNAINTGLDGLKALVASLEAWRAGPGPCGPGIVRGTGLCTGQAMLNALSTDLTSIEASRQAFDQRSIIISAGSLRRTLNCLAPSCKEGGPRCLTTPGYEERVEGKCCTKKNPGC